MKATLLVLLAAGCEAKNIHYPGDQAEDPTGTAPSTDTGGATDEDTAGAASGECLRVTTELEGSTVAGKTWESSTYLPSGWLLLRETDGSDYGADDGEFDADGTVDFSLVTP